MFTFTQNDVPPEVWERARARAVRDGWDTTALLVELLRAYGEGHASPGPLAVPTASGGWRRQPLPTKPGDIVVTKDTEIVALGAKARTVLRIFTVQVEGQAEPMPDAEMQTFEDVNEALGTAATMVGSTGRLFLFDRTQMLWRLVAG